MKFLNESVENEKTIGNLNSLGRSLYGMSSDDNPKDSYPISPSSAGEWDVLASPERYRRKFEFTSPKEVLYFINELYKYQFKINHHCKIVVENLEVTVESYTHDYNGITAQDKKIKKIADELYDDLNYLNDEK